MLDIAPSEFLLVAFIALVVIGPKDLPKALRVIGHWVGRARAVGRQFRSGFDEMVREAELAEMEKKWKAENERIMREHAAPITDSAVSHAAGDELAPVMVEQPQMIKHPQVEPTAQPSGSEQAQATTSERPAADAPVTDNRAAS